MKSFDVIDRAPGHAGCEAAYAAARPRRARWPVHAVDRHRRAHAVQSGDRRHCEGSSRARDRCARRADGPRDRRDRHPVQAAQPQPRAGGLVAARAGRQEGLRTLGEGGARRRAEHRVVDRQAGRRSLVEHGQRGWSGDGRRRCVRVPRAGHHDRHVSRTGSFTSVWNSTPAGRAGEPPSRELAESLKSLRLRDGVV